MQELYEGWEIRKKLLHFSGIEKAFFDVAINKCISGDIERKLKELEEIIEMYRKEEKEFAVSTIERLIKFKEITSSDFREMNNIIQDCKNNLNSSLKEIYELDVPITETKEKEYTQLKSELHSYLSSELKRDKKVGIVKDMVFRRPGMYLNMLKDVLQIEYGEEGLSYNTIRNIINQLVEDGWVITIGGPKGKLRYSFPNPERVPDRRIYYGGLFGIKGELQEDVTDYFDYKKIKDKWINIFKVNGHIDPILLITDFGVIENLEGCFIGTFGNIDSIDRFIEVKGVVPVEDKADQFEDNDVLFAKKIATVIDGEEKEVWVSEDLS